MSKPPSKTFTATFLGTGPNQRVAYCELPFDSEALFGSKGRIPVEVKLNGVTLQMALAPKGQRENHQLLFNQALVKEAGIEIGQSAKVSIALDTAPRTVEIPEPLAKILKKDPVARKAWEALAPSVQKEHALGIAEAKRPETLEKRLDKALALLTGKASARPAPSSKPLSQRLHLREDQQVTLLGAPQGLALDRPTTTKLSKKAEVILLFAKDSQALGAWLPKLEPVAGTATLWIAYPKRTSGVKTDLTRDRGWEPVEALGLGPIQQVSIDDTWSGLRFKPRT
ncbi:MAG TPA: YdeI/OmpD-associated family protein [Myxococcaceae bacterium]|nr:YdeI/OmpD-associated family protein [Myxococcaceae bacterium]